MRRLYPVDESPLKIFWESAIGSGGSKYDDYGKGYNAGLQWEYLVWHDPLKFPLDYQMGFADGKGDMIEWTGNTTPARLFS